MAQQAWQEDGYWWAQDEAGNLYWLSGRTWKRYRPPIVFKQALKQSVVQTGSDLYANFQTLLPYLPYLAALI